MDIAKNGAFTVEPDTGFAFVKKVSGTVNVPGVDFSQVTATPNNVLNTKQFFDNSGNLVYGTMLPGANCPANYSLGDENLTIDIVGGADFPADLSGYDLVIQCGACMFNRKYVMSRINEAKKQEIPMSNYGIVIAYLNGILDKITVPKEESLA